MFPLYFDRQKIYEKIFGLARGEMNRELRKLHNRILRDLYPSTCRILSGRLNEGSCNALEI